jgi:hypothetical protein
MGPQLARGPLRLWLWLRLLVVRRLHVHAPGYDAYGNYIGRRLVNGC